MLKYLLFCLGGALIAIGLSVCLANAQSVPGVAATAPQAWTGPGVLGRDVVTAGDAPDLLAPSVNSATESLLQFSGTNGSASTVYVQVFKANTLPGNGTNPINEIAVPAGVSFYFYAYPIQSTSATGFVIACSTTQGSLTITSTNDCFISAKVSP